MEQSKRENQLLFKRLLVYHCFRDSKSASQAASLLNQIYQSDEQFVSQQTAEWLYGKFSEANFNFDDLCQVDFLQTNAETEAEPSQEPITSVSDDPLLDELTDNSVLAITPIISIIEERESEDAVSINALPEPTVVKRKRGRPRKSAAKLVPPPKPNSKNPKTAKNKKEAAVRQRSSLPREASKPKPPPPPPKPKEKKKKIRKRAKSTSEDETETESELTDDRFLLPKALTEAADQTTANIEGNIDCLGSLNMGGHKRRNLRRRQLILHCYQAKYNTVEAARYLCSVYGKGFASKSSVISWYRKFRRNDFSLDDGKRPGRAKALNQAELAAFMAANPDSTTTMLAEKYNVCRVTMVRCLHKLGYHFVVDRWQKVADDGSSAERVTDHQLCEYKLRHPEATLRQMAEHFLVNRGVVAIRLRALGFDIPKWPVYAKKRYNTKEKRWEYTSLGLHVLPGENVRKKTYKEIKAAAEEKKRKAAAAAAATATATDLASSIGDEAAANSAAPSAEQQLQMLELVQLDAQQQRQQQQQKTTLDHSSTTSSTILPAVLRHKTATTTISAITTATVNSIISSSTGGNINLQSASTSHFNPAYSSSHFQMSLPQMQQLSGNQALSSLEQQQTLQAATFSICPTNSAVAAGGGQLQFNSGVYHNDSFAQLTDAQVQSLLHPYYM